MEIPFYNFESLHDREFRDVIEKRIHHIIEQNTFIEGEFNLQFEREFALMQKTQHCLLVSNGTDALELALQVYGIKPGDKVGVPGITFCASAEAILNVGAEPVFIDVDETGLICPRSTERMCRKHQLKAVMTVHIYGLPAPMKELESICHTYKIPLIEDAAQAQGTFFDDKQQFPVGSTQNLTTFSFYPTKNLSAFGDAGCVLTQDANLAELIKSLRNHGRSHAQKLGRNSRCDHIQAAVLQLKLAKAPAYNKKRKDIATKYHKRLAAFENSGEKGLKLLPSSFLPRSSWHLYPVQLASVEIRKRLQNFLKSKGIASAPFYEKALSQEAALAGLSGEDKMASSLAGRILCLPIHPFLSEEEIQIVADTVGKFFDS